MLLYAHPLHERFRHAGAADIIAVECGGRHDPDALGARPRRLALEAHEFPRQAVIGRLQLRAVLGKVPVAEPDEKTGAEVVVAGYLVVQAQAVAALAGEAGGGAGHEGGEALLQRRGAHLFVIEPAQFQTLHQKHHLIICTQCRATAAAACCKDYCRLSARKMQAKIPCRPVRRTMKYHLDNLRQMSYNYQVT